MSGVYNIAYPSRRLKKETAIRHIAVRETSVSWHHGGTIEDLLKLLGPSRYYRIGGFKGALHWASIMLRTPVSRTAALFFSQLYDASLHSLYLYYNQSLQFTIDRNSSDTKVRLFSQDITFTHKT